MNRKALSNTLCQILALLTCSGHNSAKETSALDAAPIAHIKKTERKRTFSVLMVVLLLFSTGCTAVPQEQDILSYRFADREEGISLFKENSHYYDNFTQNDLDYRLQKKDGKVGEWLSFACEQVRDFSDEERAAIDRSMSNIRSILAKKGYVLPELEEIIFVKTTMKEENNAGAYTHRTQIYLGEAMLKNALSDKEEDRRFFDMVMSHEIFHCLTRSNAQFRKDMYEIIGFTIAEEEFEMGPAIRDSYISNPDVERHDSYAEFTIDGEKVNCFIVFVATKSFEMEGDSFFEDSTMALVPIDDPNVFYTMEDASDFWDVFGRNTQNVKDPEECLAYNFSYAVIYGNTNEKGEPLESPHITAAIDAYLRG